MFKFIKDISNIKTLVERVNADFSIHQERVERNVKTSTSEVLKTSQKISEQMYELVTQCRALRTAYNQALDRIKALENGLKTSPKEEKVKRKYTRKPKEIKEEK